MKYQDYKNYLYSHEWQQKRQARLEIDLYRCQGCGEQNSNTPLECHHLNYYRLGKENVYTDLVSLCPKCHKGVHRILNRITGVKTDGTPRRGWKDTLPSSVIKDLKKRELM